MQDSQYAQPSTRPCVQRTRKPLGFFFHSSCDLSVIAPKGVSQPVRKGKGAAVISATTLQVVQGVCETAPKMSSTHQKTPGAQRLGDRGDEAA